MGMAKRMMMEAEDNAGMAQELLVELDLMEECPAHEVFYETNLFEPDEDELTDAVNKVIASGKFIPPKDMTREQLVELLMETLSEAPDECYICRSNFEKD
jgi:hypothetical protein